jgi:hypothetical protein
MSSVMAPPRAVIVPEVMVSICGVNPQDNFRRVHDVFFCFSASGTREKQKPPTHQGGGFQSSGGDLFGEFPHHTSSGTFVPDQGHLNSPLPGCQTRFRVIPDVGPIVSSQRLDATKFCVIRNSRTMPCLSLPELGSE